jgi:putative ABC transport system substrate-binding protein
MGCVLHAGKHQAVKRRDFITLLSGSAVAWPLAAHAQQRTIPVIGVLWPGNAPPASPRMESLRQTLRQLGFVEGQNVEIQLRYAERGLQQLPELAAELVGMKVDVILAFGDLGPRIAQQATKTIPIVAISDDILGAGLISSLSRPNGNITGFTILSPELSAKRLQVLQEIVPGVSRVAALWDPTTGISQVSMTQSVARSLNLKLQIVEVQSRNEMVEAFRAARNEGAEALNVFSSPFLSSLYQEIIDLSAEHRLPAIYQWKEHAEAGGLISYGPGLAAMWRQSGAIVVRVLKGAKPADVPVEQPTKFELVVNLKTARVLGLEIPPMLLGRADDVIE